MKQPLNSTDSPNCWTALSALHGISRVMWTRLFWFGTRLSAWREIPELAASDIIATYCETIKKKKIKNKSNFFVGNLGLFMFNVFLQSPV